MYYKDSLELISHTCIVSSLGWSLASVDSAGVSTAGLSSAFVSAVAFSSGAASFGSSLVSVTKNFLITINVCIFGNHLCFFSLPSLCVSYPLWIFFYQMRICTSLILVILIDLFTCFLFCFLFFISFFFRFLFFFCFFFLFWVFLCFFWLQTIEKN